MPVSSMIDRAFRVGMTIVSLLIALFLCTCVSSLANADEWSRADTAREIAFQVVNVADAYQTSRIQYTENVVEGMPVTRAILGAEPSTRDTVLYFGTVGITHYLIGRLLPEKYRKYWQGGTLTFSAVTVYNNCQVSGC